MNKTISQDQSWVKFYKDRVASEEYENKFRNKYSLFLEVIKSLSLGGMVKEEGIGIGSVSKALMNMGINKDQLYGSDIDKDMITLCSINLDNRVKIFREDIFSVSKKYTSNTNVICTHGVLEHFSDQQIHNILYSHRVTPAKFGVHYVPTDMYPEPSFGDERLLPIEHWIRTFNPFHYYVDNHGKDLYLIFKHR